MKNFFKILIISSFVFITAIFSSNNVFASTATITTGTTVKAVLVSDINIIEPKIISQEENKVQLSFSISNGEGSQSGIKYGVKLIKETTKGQLLVDEYVYPESLNLNPNTVVKKEVTYTAPANLSGEYTVLVVAKNNSNQGVGLGSPGKIKLVSTVKAVEISPETCSLSILDEKGNKTYTLYQGVDISAAESLKLTCTGTNSSKSDISAVPFYETHYRNIGGEIVFQEGGDMTPISFKAGEKKTFSLILPKATKPQAYDVKVSLKSGEDFSNSIIAHYVLQGASATIQNLSLDKDYYKKGEIANISFTWTPSADSFPESRIGGGGTSLPKVTLSATITNNLNGRCIAPINQTLGGDSHLNIQAKIVHECRDAKTTVILKDENGKILDQKEYIIKTTSVDKPIPYSLYAILILIVIATIYFYLKNKKNLNSSQKINISLLFFAFVVFSGMFIPIKEISAQYIFEFRIDDNDGGSGTATNPTPTPPPTPPSTITLNANITTGVYYAPGETITVYTDATRTTCSNTSYDIEIYGAIFGIGDYVTITKQNVAGGTTIDGSRDYTAPTTPGDYILKIGVDVYAGSYWYAYADGDDYIKFYNLSDANTTLATDFPGRYEFIYNGSNPAIYSYGNGNVYNLTQVPVGTQVIATTIIEKTIKVRGVTVRVAPGYPNPANYDGNTKVQWMSTNASTCSCTFSPAINGNNNCGSSSSSGNNIWVDSAIIPNLKNSTAISVNCI